MILQIPLHPCSNIYIDGSDNVIIQVLNEALIGLYYELRRIVDKAVDTYLLFEISKYQIALVLRH